jgi:KUP system potassium uptake protein
MRGVWRWPVIPSALICAAFLAVDVGFFGANLFKIADGGWLPLTLGAVIFFIMWTWRDGLDAVRASLGADKHDPKRFLQQLRDDKIPRVPGTAVFLTRARQSIPTILVDHVKHMGALHSHVIALTVNFEVTPRVAPPNRCHVKPVGDGIVHAEVSFGFVEIPDLGRTLSDVKALQPEFEIDTAIFFGTRDQVVARHGSPVLSRWRLPVFSFLYRNAVKVVDRFHLPPSNVVEIARQIEI